MISRDEAHRILKICNGTILPETLRESICLEAYKLRVTGAPMDYCIDNMNPNINEMDVHQLRYFLMGLAFAEQKIITFDDTIDITDDSDNKKYH